MKKFKRLIKSILAIGLIILLEGCVGSTEFEGTTEGENESDKVIVEKLDEKEINSERINIWLSDNIQIDADITPYDRYKNGLGSYNFETVDYYKYDDPNCLTEYGITQAYNKFFSVEDNENITISGLNCTINPEDMYFKHNAFARELTYMSVKNTQLTKEVSKELLSMANAKAEELCKAFQNAGYLRLGTYYKLRYIDEATFIPFDEYYVQMNDTGLNTDYDNIRNSKEAYFNIVTYGMIEDIPIFNDSIYFEEEDSSKMSKNYGNFPPSKNYALATFSEIECSIDTLGNVIELQICDNVKVGDKIKDYTNIIDINKVLEVVKEKFDKYNSYIRVSNIELAYEGIISEELNDNGIRKQVLEPVWVIRYVGDGSSTKMAINAITGEQYEAFMSR